MKRFFFLAIFFPMLFSCANETSRLVLWTDCVDFVSYTELFNASQDKIKIVALYKDDLTGAMPPSKSEPHPDIVAGAFLRSGMQKKYFSRIDSIFGKNALSREIFYPSILESGKLRERQYLLPVSFNLPALVFHTNNYDYAQNAFFSFDDIKEASQRFNEKNDDGSYGAMAFGPHWNSDFLYLIFKTAGVSYTVQNGKLVYSEGTFQSTVSSTNEWSELINDGVQNELDFAFKYLYMPFHDQLQSGRSLFAYASSDRLMSLPEDQLETLDFRWICNDGKIQIEDDAIMMGIYSASKNKAAAKKFLIWFMNEESQKKMLERKFAMKLRTQTFGIASGFSSIQSVNKNIFPFYYRHLMSNIPMSEYLKMPQTFISDWSYIKSKIILPFILASTEESAPQTKPLAELYDEYVAEKEASLR